MNWSIKTAEEIANRAIRILFSKDEDISLMRMGENAIFMNSRKSFVVRVHRPSKTRIEVLNEINICKFLSDENFPCPKLCIELEGEPLKINNVYVTVWQYIDHDAKGECDIRLFGTLLEKFHSLTQNVDFSLPHYNPFIKMKERLKMISKLENAQIEDITCLTEWTNNLQFKYEHNKSVFSKGVIHGDAHLGNVLASKGGMYLIDYENISLGDQAWDIVPIFVQNRRFGLTDEQIDEFSIGYGNSIVNWDFFSDAILIRELYMTLWLFQNVDISVDAKKEINHRMKFWKKSDKDICNWNKL